MGETSWQVKAKYNKKTYKRIVADLPKDLVAKWEDKLKSEGIKKAEFIRDAIKSYLEED